jgi:hypothetical protein
VYSLMMIPSWMASSGVTWSYSAVVAGLGGKLVEV